MLSTQRPEQKSTVIVRLASTDDIAHVEAIHKVVNRAYRSEGGWTTEAHLVTEERITVDELKDALVDKINPLLLAFDSETHEPLGTIQLEPAEHYPDFGDYKKEGYVSTHTETVPKDQQVFLGLFSVDPAQQSRGIGRKLVEAALAHARTEMKRTQCVVYVLYMRAELIKWYTKLGFVDHGEKVNFPDSTRIIQKDTHFAVLRLPL